MKPYDGDMESYREELLAERAPRTKLRERGEDPDLQVRTTRADARRSAAERRAALAPLKKVMQAAEKNVEQLSADIARLDAALASPELYADAAKAQRLAIERGQLAKRLADAEESLARRDRCVRGRTERRSRNSIALAHHLHA